MSNPFEKPSNADDQLWQLVEAFCDGNATITECDALNERLAADPAARRFYLAYLQTHAELAWQRRGQIEPAVPPSPSLALPPSPRRRLALSSVAWSILAASLLFAGYVVTISWNMLGKQLASSPDHLSPLSPDQGRGAGGEGQTVATIRETSNVEWSSLTPASTRGEVAAIAPGQPLSIQSGLIELQLHSGTTLLIEGPADWKIDGENSATLTHGKLVANVPQQAIGFTLETPTAKIVDLGTEFGVEVAQDGAAEVHVVRGKIDVQSSGIVGSEQSYALETGQSVQITNRGAVVPSESPAIPEKFKRLVKGGNKEPAPLATNPTTGLVAYYPFNGETRDHAAEYTSNAGKVADDLKLIGKGEFLAGQVGRGLRLEGGYCTAPISSDLQLPPTFTIEAWIVAVSRSNDFQRLVLNWGPAGQQAYHLAIFNNQLSLYINQADGKELHLNGGDLRIERWEHVAAVADGKLLRLYLNGIAVGTQPYDGTLFVNTTEGLGFGDSATEHTPSQRFHGCIDDLAIWRIPLSAEQIAEHVRRNRHGIPLTSANRKEANGSNPSK